MKELFKIITVFFAFLFSQVDGYAQKYPFEKWDAATLSKANTAEDVDYLNKVEKEVIFYTNLVRINPELFAQTYLQSYLDSTKTKNKKWITSLKKYLLTANNAGVLIPEKDLFEEAEIHANDMGKSGKIGHNTSNGDDFSKRIGKLKNSYSVVYENCQYGFKDALSIVIDLLIDEGIADYGHRKALLYSDLKYIGTSIQHHKKYRYNCVIDFGGEMKKH